MGRSGIKIVEVEQDSPGSRMRLAPGDEILAINGHPIADEIALRFYLAEEHALIEVRKASGNEEAIEVDLSEGASLGIQVEDFKTRTCNNSCLFCFIDQLPPGARPSLLVKDDDYRLSFLHGNYVTLTNLGDRDLDRIIEQALSPLYVSVHATDPEVRTRVMGRRKADDLDRKMRKLISGGIRLHTQIVLMPEINDGAHLERTVFDLFGYYPGVDSVAIVPLGLSDHGSPRHRFIPVTAEYCDKLVRTVHPWQEHFRTGIGKTFAYLADEFYIQGGLPLPQTDYYDDFAQIEDGIGMVRRFLNDFNAEFRRRRKPRPDLHGTLATAKLFFPYLRNCIDRLNEKIGARLRVVEIENRYIGHAITVAGLLAGRDILAGLQGVELGDWLIIPNEALSRTEGVFVDSLSPKDLERDLGLPVYPSGRTMHDFFELLAQAVER